MTHAALAPGIGREFDPFLFASIGEGQHGHRLTVISALAQSGVDPWLEAIGLARLSRELATARLSRLIAALPGLPLSNRPADSIAEELVALLPRTDRFTPSSQATPTPPTAVIMMSPNARWGAGHGRFGVPDRDRVAVLDAYVAGSGTRQSVCLGQRQGPRELEAGALQSPPMRPCRTRRRLARF